MVFGCAMTVAWISESWGGENLQAICRALVPPRPTGTNTHNMYKAPWSWWRELRKLGLKFALQAVDFGSWATQTTDAYVHHRSSATSTSMAPLVSSTRMDLPWQLLEFVIGLVSMSKVKLMELCMAFVLVWCPWSVMLLWTTRMEFVTKSHGAWGVSVSTCFIVLVTLVFMWTPFSQKSWDVITPLRV